MSSKKEIIEIYKARGLGEALKRINNVNKARRGFAGSMANNLTKVAVVTRSKSNLSVKEANEELKRVFGTIGSGEDGVNCVDIYDDVAAVEAAISSSTLSNGNVVYVTSESAFYVVTLDDEAEISNNLTSNDNAAFAEPDWSTAGAPDASFEPWTLTPTPIEGNDINYRTVGTGITMKPVSELEPIIFQYSGVPPVPCVHLFNDLNAYDWDLDFTNGISELTIALLVKPSRGDLVNSHLVYISTGSSASAARLLLEWQDGNSRNGHELNLYARRLDGDSIASTTIDGFLPERWAVLIIQADWANGIIRLFSDGVEVGSVSTSSGAVSSTDALQARFGQVTNDVYAQGNKFRAIYLWKSLPAIGDIQAQIENLDTSILGGELSITSNTTITVPDGVSYATVRCWGAGGGGAYGDARGGGGAYVAADLPVTPGETLTIDVGTGGGKGGNGGTGNPGAPGGGTGNQTATYKGGGGGGYSAIRKGATYHIVAGAGGGAGTTDATPRGTGGAGGIAAAEDGGDIVGNAGTGGKGATDLAGGAGGVDTGTSHNGQDGSSLQGGDAWQGSEADGAGGGGGGWYGGGGGANDGSDGACGGGGSSYVIGTATNVTTRAGSGADAGGAPPAGFADGGLAFGVGYPGLVKIQWGFE